MDLEKINAELQDKTPDEIIRWGLSLAKKTIVTTNFGPYEASILHAVTQAGPDTPVVWCDSGYNTSATYRFAQDLIEQLNLKVDLYVPRQSAAHRDVLMNGIPEVDDPLHEEFTYQVKLEPFSRAMQEHQPGVWFTNLRQDQTEFRASLDIVSLGQKGVVKIAPFFLWSEAQLDEYLATHQLRNEKDYYDPTKVHGDRECGLHTQTDAASSGFRMESGSALTG